MKTLTVRLPESLVAEIQHESQARRVSKSDVVRERLHQPRLAASAGGNIRDLIGDLIGSVRNDGLPKDLSSNKKKYLPELIRAKNIIADSSALVALVRYDDQHHRWLNAQIDSLPRPWHTCEAALSEAFYLVGERGVPKIKEMLRRGAVVLSFNLCDELQTVLALMDKYADVPMSLVDACLVRMSETLPSPLVLTTDADFKIYRRHSRQVVPCLMPSVEG